MRSVALYVHLGLPDGRGAGRLKHFGFGSFRRVYAHAGKSCLNSLRLAVKNGRYLGAWLMRVRISCWSGFDVRQKPYSSGREQRAVDPAVAIGRECLHASNLGLQVYIL